MMMSQSNKKKGRRFVACLASTESYLTKAPSLLALPLISRSQKLLLTVLLTVTDGISYLKTLPGMNQNALRGTAFVIESAPSPQAPNHHQKERATRMGWPDMFSADLLRWQKT